MDDPDESGQYFKGRLCETVFNWVALNINLDTLLAVLLF